jgi:hypothetical protein
MLTLAVATPAVYILKTCVVAMHTASTVFPSAVLAVPPTEKIGLGYLLL